MKKSNFLANRSGFMGMILFVLATTFGISSCKPDFDLDKRFPEWLGTSIFETLNEGFEGDSGKVYKFTYFVRLIQDLDQEKILAKTGSKTLFVADDEAFDKRFFGPNCPFKKADGTPVSSYDELSVAQKTMILKGAMLNNVYQVAMLSSSEGPTIGDCMRRLTSSSIYDTVPVLLPKDMPKYSELWKTAKTREAGIPIMQDGTVRPMVLFVNKFLTSRKMTDDDYDFLFNQGRYDKTGTKPARNPADASVNGVRIEFQNKKCFNGFIHVMADVIYLLPNMAEYLESSDKATIYSSIVDRFSAPFYPSEEHKNEIKRLLTEGIIKSDALAAAMLGTKDSVYTKMYLSKRSQGDKKNNKLPSGLFTSDRKNTLPDDELLRFDPGWNGFFSQTSSTTATNVALQQNMSVMMVPTDATLKSWWLTGAGKALREMYHDPDLWPGTNLTYEEVARDMSFIPRNVIVKLVNNNMLNSLTGSVPSKFGNVLNDANDPMFDRPDSAANTIESVVMCCNGAIYFTTTVYAPTAYRSVSYPALVNPKLKIIDAAIQDEVLSFSAYLNSMVATYSFFTPLVKDTADANLNGKLIWIDPVSFGAKKYKSAGNTQGQYLKAMVFSYNAASANAFKVEAQLYNYNDTTNKLMSSVGSVITDADIIRDRLEDLLDYHIILDNVEGDSDGQNVPWDENGYAYFKTKGRGMVRFKMGINPSTVDPLDEAAYNNMLSTLEVAGGWQIETGEKINVVDRIDLSRKSSSNGNGRTYIIDKPLGTSRMSVYDILSDSITYPEFKAFFKLMESATGSDNKPLFASTTNKHEVSGRMAVTTFNTYHYTIYVPTNQAIQDLLDAGVIRKPADIAAISTKYSNILTALKAAHGPKADSIYKDTLMALSMRLRNAAPGSVPTAKDSAFKLANYTDSLKDQLKNFIKYHIQDNSVYCNSEFKAGYDEQGNTATVANYETAFMNKNQQFVKLEVKGGADITVKDANGNVRHVVKGASTGVGGKPLFNIMCREYEYDKTSVTDISSTQIETSSYVVIHQIDGALSNGDVVF